jgi:Ser/Thr protein kinase RdoA (MazF antagonist)
MNSHGEHGKPDPKEAEEVARDHFGLAAPQARFLPGGRVNVTFQVENNGQRFILQRLSPFFQNDEALGLNWNLAVQALAERAAPSMIPTIFPSLAPEPGENRFLAIRPGWDGAWRLTSFRPGRPAPKNQDGARAAARTLGELHRLLNQPAPIRLLNLPEGEFTNRRMATAEELSLWPDLYRGHPNQPAILPLWGKMAAAALELPGHPDFLDIFRLREVVIHGDPKSDNFLMDQTGAVQSVLDWDTAGLGHFLADVGEMLRSFGGNAKTGEELAAAEAVVEGYAETGFAMTEAEVELLPAVWRGLAINLSRRYLADALAEVFFLWDSRAYPSLYDQNRQRGADLLTLADRLLEKEMELAELLRAAARRGQSRRTTAWG